MGVDVPCPNQASKLPELGASPALAGWTTPLVPVHGAAAPVSKPGLPSSCAGVQPDDGFTVHMNDVFPVAPVVSLAVTMTLEVPAVVGVPEIRPLEVLIERPAGKPVAE